MTARRRLVVHVGPHKTASTYIQANLHRARRQLRHVGWLYPRLDALSGERAHHTLAHARDPEADIARLARLWNKAPGMSIILSSEGFSAWSAERFTRLRTALGADTLEIIYVLRDPVERLASYWAEEVKQGKTESLPERLARELTNPLASPFLNPAVALRPWMTEPGLQLHLVPYEYLTSCGRDVFEHITGRVLGLVGLRAKPGPANERLPLEITEFIRFLNLNTKGPDAALRIAFMRSTTCRERTDIVRLIAQEAAEARRHLTVPYQAAFLRHIERRLVEDFAPTFTVNPGPAPLFRHKPHDFSYYADAGLWQSEAVRAKARSILDRIVA